MKKTLNNTRINLKKQIIKVIKVIQIMNNSNNINLALDSRIRGNINCKSLTTLRFY
jgi:hypothetical protein